MDLKTVLSEVESWPSEERLQLIEKLWESLCEERLTAEPCEETKRLLDRRLEALERNPDDVVPWETVEARAFERFRE